MVEMLTKHKESAHKIPCGIDKEVLIVPYFLLEFRSTPPLFPAATESNKEAKRRN